jgi:hypothetical protein
MLYFKLLFECENKLSLTFYSVEELNIQQILSKEVRHFITFAFLFSLYIVVKHP